MGREVLIARRRSEAARRQAAVHHIALIRLQRQLQLILEVDGLSAGGASVAAATHRGVDAIGIDLLIPPIVVTQVSAIWIHSRRIAIFRSVEGKQLVSIY